MAVPSSASTVYNFFELTRTRSNVTRGLAAQARVPFDVIADRVTNADPTQRDPCHIESHVLEPKRARSKWTSSRRGAHEPALGYASPTLCRARNPASTMVDASAGGATPALP
jgi:hypothetical protein